MDVEVANVKQQPAANDMISYDRSKLRILLDFHGSGVPGSMAMLTCNP